MTYILHTYLWKVRTGCSTPDTQQAEVLLPDCFCICRMITSYVCMRISYEIVCLLLFS